MQWRKVKTADYNEFNLIIDDSYKTMPDDEYVYNHKGEQLYWFNHNDIAALPKNIISIDDIAENANIYLEEFAGEEWKFTAFYMGDGFHHSVKGFDCEGVPVFSHNTATYAETHYSDLNQFEPLTVGMIKLWLGWFLYQLKNVDLQTRK